MNSRRLTFFPKLWRPHLSCSKPTSEAMLQRATQCRSWVKLGSRRSQSCGRLFPRQQTSGDCSRMSVSCQQRKSGVLFNDLVGASYQCVWNGEAERLGGLEIDEKLD